jgi:hypothetical protein
MARLTKILEKALASSPKVPKKESISIKAAETLDEVVRAIEIRRKLIELKSFQAPGPSKE